MHNREKKLRPKAGTVLGVLNIIFCAFGLLGGLIGFIVFGIFNTALNAFAQYTAEYQMILTAAQNMFTIIIIITVIQFIINAAGLTGGIGLLADKSWSITVSDIYAAATIVLLFANFLIMKYLLRIIFENPAFTSQVSSGDMIALQSISRFIPVLTGITSVIFGSAYPIVLLSLVNRKVMRDYYSGEPRSE